MQNINVGCGRKKIKGFLNIDISSDVKPDMIIDITEGLPFEDNSVAVIYSNHFLEHITKDKLKFVLEEFYRVSYSTSQWIFDLPFDNSNNRCCSDHFSTFWFTSFDYYLFNSPANYMVAPVKLKSVLHHSRIERYFYTLFPFMTNNIHFWFEVIKEEK